MNNPKTKYAAAAVITIAILMTFVVSPHPVSAQQVLQDAIEAVSDIRSVHMKARMRTLPRDNFSHIGLHYDFVPIDMWKRVNDDGLNQWRVEKPGRVLLMDGLSTTMLIRPNYGVRTEEPLRLGCYDTWCAPLLNVQELLDHELKEAHKHPNRKVLLSHETIEGQDKTILQIELEAEVSKEDYLHNKFIMLADRTKIYQFDAKTKLLESFHVFVHTEDKEVLVFEVTEIAYNSDIDDSVFTLDLPEDINWHTDSHARILPNNEQYENMTPKETATAILQACARKEWEEVLKFKTDSRIEDRFKAEYGGLTILSINEPFQSEAQDDQQWFVPYEIKTLPKESTVRVSNKNAAGRFVIMGLYDSNMQLWKPVTWESEPATLAPDSPYTKMSPEEVVKTFNTALINLDFEKMKMFMPAELVEQMMGPFVEEVKQNPDLQKMLPRLEEVVKTFWSEEHKSYFVTCTESSTIIHNLSLRKDIKANRFVIDGGL
ncbi:hypothetical protein ACFL6U_00915 [Planctomycetota bacterium]